MRKSAGPGIPCVAASFRPKKHEAFYMLTASLAKLVNLAEVHEGNKELCYLPVGMILHSLHKHCL